MPKFQTQYTLFLKLVGLFLTAVLLYFILSYYVGVNFLLINNALYTTIKATSAVFAIITAYFLLQLDAINKSNGYNKKIATALIFMGSLNVIYAVQPLGSPLHFLPEITLFIGGFLFATILIPASFYNSKLIQKYGKASYAISIVTVTTLFFWIIFFPKQITDVTFAKRAQLPLNVIGGCLLLITAIKLWTNFLVSKKPTDLYISMQCGILASTAILLEFSTAWNLHWWILQCLQMIGYSVGIMLCTSFVKLAHIAQSNSGTHYSKKRIPDSDALLATLNYHAIISIADRTGNIIEVNDAFCKISGFSREELIGKNHRIINSGLQSADFWSSMWQDISSGIPWRGEVCNRTKQGSLYWVDTVIAPFVDKNGLIEKYVSIRTDITASKKSALSIEHAMRDANALLSTLNLHAIVSVANRAGIIIEVNDAFCKISGYSRQELIGQNHRIINSGTHPPEFWLTMWKTISVGMPWRGQVCNCAKNGSHYWVDTFISPFIDEFGQIEKYISIRTDITGSKLAEEALRWNESLLKMMSNSSPLAFLVVDTRNDKILYFNQQFCTIWGLEQVAEDMHNGTLKYKEVFQKCINVVAYPAAYIESCQPLQEETNRVILEDEIPFKNDRVVRRYSTQIRDSSDNYFGRFYIFEEITDSKHVERALKQASEAAQAASLAKSQFLANVSHELRTPMNTILGMLTLLRKTELTPKQIDYAAKSTNAARSLLGLLNEVLDFSKIEAGKMMLDFHAFSLDQMLLDLSDILSNSIDDKPLVVKFHIDPNTPNNLLGDSMRLQQIMINLSSNAIKFTEKGEVIVSITIVRKTTAEVTLKFSVQDTGIGIAPQNHSTIFKGFIQAESSITRRYGGTGLGLAISQHLVELMGGTIELESALGQGSLFYFSISLPILNNIKYVDHKTFNQHEITNQNNFLTTNDSINSDNHSALAPNPDNNGLRLYGIRILVAEDNANNQQVIKELLECDGALIHIVNNGQEAIDAISNSASPFDLVLMDLQMPVMDGFTATTQIRVNLGLQNLPIIAMTANAMTSDREASLAAGMNNHIGKPFDINHLVNVILKHVGKAHAPNVTLPQNDDGNSTTTNQILTQSVLNAAQDANVDLIAALNRIRNRNDLYLRLLRTFISEITAMPNQFHQRLSAGEFTRLRHEFHALKGAAGTLGVNVLMQEASLAEAKFTDALSISTAESVVHQICNKIAATASHLMLLSDVLQTRQNELILNANNEQIVIEKLANNEMITMLKNLTQQLQNSDMAAIESINLLQKKSNVSFVAQLTPLEEAIHSLNFEKAQQLCNALLENLTHSKPL